MRNDDEIHLKPAAVVGLMVALFSGNVLLTTQWTKPEAVRPDPFTGTMGAEMRNQLQGEIDALKHRVEFLQQHGPDGVRRELEELRRQLRDCADAKHPRPAG